MTEEIQSNESENTNVKSKKAYYAWVGAVIFSIVFTFIIWSLGPLLDNFVLGPDQGASWYYWKLPTREFMTMLIVWGFYLTHQFAIWGSIYWAQKNLIEYKTKPTSGLTNYNWATLLINAVFIVLHLVQTHIWFDGLAQDVPIFTSQGSVIIMLVLILIIENPRRGLFMGRKAGKPITAQVSGFFRRNHQYIIAWALVYTFWFHPMAYDPQLVTGFFYMFLLFTQVSLAYTVVHVKRGWVVLLESFVGIHAFFVAVYNWLNLGSSDMWAMFTMGFAFLFVFTYIYTFKFRKEIRWVATIAYIAALVWIYLPESLGGYFNRNPTDLFRMEFLWIPIILYLLAYVFAGVVYIFLKRKAVAET